MFLTFGVSLPIFHFEAISHENPLTLAATRTALVLSQLAVSAIGVWRCYLANGGRAGFRFAERFIALGWVVGMRIGLLLLPGVLLLVALRIDLTTLWVDGTTVALSAVYFWRLCFHISWVARHAESAA
jgi:hypothetical protein